MRSQIRDFLIKPILALAVAIPVAGFVQVPEADAGSRKAAIIAGAIIGGAIAYHHYKRNKRYRHYNRRVYYGYPRYNRVRYHRHYHRHAHRHHYYNGYYWNPLRSYR